MKMIEFFFVKSYLKDLNDRVRVEADVLDHQLHGSLKLSKVAHHVVRIQRVHHRQAEVAQDVVDVDV